MPIIAWDEGIYRLRDNLKSDKCLFLSFTWENYLCLIEFKKKYSFTEEVFFLEPTFLGKISFPEKLIYMGYIGIGVIFGIDEKKNSFCIYSDDIDFEAETKNDKVKQLMNMDRYAFKSNQEIHQIGGTTGKSSIYQHFIITHRDLNAVYIVLKDEIFMKGEIYSPKSLINK
jgi:hypothetical protein